MINKVNNFEQNNLYKNLKKSVKPLDKFIQSQENLSHTRFIGIRYFLFRTSIDR